MQESNFTPEALNVLCLARENACALGHSYVGSEHLLLALSALEENVGRMLQNRGVAEGALRKVLAAQMGVGKIGGPCQGLTVRCRQIIRFAVTESRQTGASAISPEHLLLGMLREGCGSGVKLLSRQGIDSDRFYRQLRAGLGGSEAPTPRRSREVERPGQTSETRLLDQCARDLTRLAAQGSLDPVIGRDEELEHIIRILSRRSKNNPALIGDPGVGKTALAEGLAQAIIRGSVPDNLRGRRVCALDLSAMVAGTKYRGEFEDKLRKVLDEVRRARNIILFVDELHTIVGAGSAEGAIDAANILKPALGRGEIQMLGATTQEEYRRYIEKDAALERRFQPVVVREPDRDSAIAILQGLRGRYERHHRLTITDEAITAAVDLSRRYLPQRFLPDKAIDLMDEAAARVRLTRHTLPPELQRLERRVTEAARERETAIQRQDYERAAVLRDAEEDFRRQLDSRTQSWHKERPAQKVTAADIQAVLTGWTGIPVTELSMEERQRLAELECTLREQVVGQDDAVQAVARAVRRGRLGLKDPDRPVGSFLFLGPSGVGKTLLCRSLAAALFGSEDSLIRFDMSEYMEAHTVSRLIGSPPGYVGHEQGGQLTERVRRAPWSVVLLDEIEKAHPDVWGLLLQIMDSGTLTDALGRKTDFRNTVVVMTSNLGAGRFSSGQLGFSPGGTAAVDNGVLADAKKTFRPEFWGRLDGTPVFHPLDSAALHEVGRKQLQRVTKRFEEMGIALEVTDSALRCLTEGKGDPAHGARPLLRAVTEQIEDPAADLLLSGQVTCGGRVLADREGDRVVLRVM
ncbi:MAG: ATP-dependent Clp protease ATP-binding subunit [Ruminococcaceae bacterium]|nr:ATP-dependent Clp protease ATP-binding subunit [Oscillospiraceae bacterium]